MTTAQHNQRFWHAECRKQLEILTEAVFLAELPLMIEDAN
jgi:hypothetical protein